MPPKKKSKSKAASAAAAAKHSEAATNAAPVIDLTLTENGIEQLRTLSQHRPQRIAVGGFGVVAPSSQSAEPARPNPVTLQIVQINRYFVDQRFWALVGVPYPVLPSPNPLPDVNNNQQQQLDVDMDNGNGNSSNTRATAAVQSDSNSATPGFDAYSDLHVAYDLIVMDGRKQLKVLLSPTLAIHLEKGGLLPYGIIQISEASMRYDETVVAGQGFLVLKQLRILAEKEADLRLADPSQALEYPAWVSAADMANKPLIGGPRSYYLSLFNDDTIHFDASNYPAQGEAERIDKEQQQMMADVDAAIEEESKENNNSGAKNRRKQRAGAVVPAQGTTIPLVMQDQVLQDPKTLTRNDVVTIKELLNRGMGYAHGDKSLVCRIFAKSRILNFGRKSALAGSSSKSELARSPFSFELLVGDESNEQIKVTLWNTLVGAYFHRLHIGQIVAIRGFRLKQARADNQFELALNPYNPIGSIRVMEGAYCVEQNVGEHIPPLTMTVSPIAVVKTMPDDSFFDVAGVVTYAGPMLREWSQPKKQFFQYRWVVIVDTSGMDAMSVKVWTNSQQSLLEEVVVSDVIYLSNLTIHSTQPASETNPNKRSIVATSTNYTQLLDVQAMQRTEHPYLLQLIKWSQQVNHADLAFYPSLYRWNLNFEQYKEMYTDMITPLRELPAVADALRFQQMKGVLVQAFLAEIIVHPAGLRPIADGVMNEQDYQVALRRLFPSDASSEEKKQSEEKIQVIEDSQPSATPASTGKRSGRKGAAATAAADATATSAADAEMVDVTQTSTMTRRSTRNVVATQPDPQTTQSSRRGRRSVEPETTDKSKAKGRRSKSASPARSTSKKGKKGGKAAKSQKGKRSASVGKAVKRGEQIVKTVAKKRKADRSASPAAEVAATAAKPTEETPAAVTAEVPTPSLSTIVHPSAPSVLATLVLRDLNGESEFRVELHDPILGHVNFEQAAGSLASTCQTPVEAPRALLGLSHMLPASAFTPKEWEAFLHQACGTPAPVKGAKKQSPSAVIQAAVKQLHDALLQTLAPRRMLATVQLTRFSYRQVESKISSVFQLDK